MGFRDCSGSRRTICDNPKHDDNLKHDRLSFTGPYSSFTGPDCDNRDDRDRPGCCDSGWVDTDAAENTSKHRLGIKPSVNSDTNWTFGGTRSQPYSSNIYHHQFPMQNFYTW